MTDLPRSWEALGTVRPGELARDRLVLHHAAQLLASFAQGHLEARPDDGHRSLIWVDDERAFRTEATKDGLYAALRVPHLLLELHQGDAALDVLGLSGRTVAEGRRWLGAAVDDVRGEGMAVELHPPEYELPDPPDGPDAPLDANPSRLEELARWYHDAFLVLDPLAANVPEASPIRCWPHHFDLATLMTFPVGGADGGARHVGVGLSPGDGAYPHPYVYVNGWPAPRPEDLPELAEPGRWHTAGWVGAVLEAPAITEHSDATAQTKTLSDYVDRAVSAMRSVVLG
jgi:hypothetical protein